MTEVEQLRNSLQNCTMPEIAKMMGIKHFNVLVYGDMGAGKSSLGCTLAAAYSNKMQHNKFHVGHSSARTITSTLQKSNITNMLNFIDTPGHDRASRNYPKEKIRSLIEGRIPLFTRLDDSNWINSRRQEVHFSDSIHAVLIVVPITAASSADVIADVKEKFNTFQHEEFWNIKGLTPVVVLTKVDSIDLAKPLDVIMKEATFMKYMTDFSAATGIPKSDMFAIANYHNSSTLDDKVNLMALKLLENLTTRACNYVKSVFCAGTMQQMKTSNKFFVTAIDNKGNTVDIGMVDIGVTLAKLRASSMKDLPTFEFVDSNGNNIAASEEHSRYVCDVLRDNNSIKINNLANPSLLQLMPNGNVAQGLIVMHPGGHVTLANARDWFNQCWPAMANYDFVMNNNPVIGSATEQVVTLGACITSSDNNCTPIVKLQKRLV